MASLERQGPGVGDHGSIVATELGGWKPSGDPARPGQARGVEAKQGVAGTSSGHGDRASLVPFQGLTQAFHEDVHDRLLDRGRDVAEPGLRDRLGLLLEEELRRRLEAAHAQVEGVPLEPSPGKRDLIRPTFPCELVEMGTGRIRQAKKLSDLVERLPRRVVAGRADASKNARLGHVVDLGVPSGGDHADVGWGELGLEPRGDEVRLDMVHPHPGDPTRHREPFRELDPDEERADEPRSDRRRDRVDLVGLKVRLSESLLHDAREKRDVRPRCQLRHHAAVLEMDVLRRDDVREDAAVFDDGRAGVVA